MDTACRHLFPVPTGSVESKIVGIEARGIRKPVGLQLPETPGKAVNRRVFVRIHRTGILICAFMNFGC